MPKRPINAETPPIQRPGILRGVLALLLLAGSLDAHAQQEIPEVISPLRVETDHNGVNMVSGKTRLMVPVLSVPAAPNLRFDYVQNAAPYMKGKQWGTSGDLAQNNYSVHTITGTSESFKCVDFDCLSIASPGSVFVPTPNASFFWRGGSGERYHFNLKMVKTTGNPFTMIYYASSVMYPNGETLTFAYDTTTLPGDPFQQTFYRPNRITSSLGYFISISYHPGAIEDNLWSRPLVAALYASAAPTTPLGRLTYSQDGSTITDLGGRIFTCQGCLNYLGAGLERWSGALTLPGESSPTFQAAAVPGSNVVGSVTRDGTAWNYAYTNLQPNSQSPGSYLYSRLTITGPQAFNTVYDIETTDFRNVIWKITDSIGRATLVDFNDTYQLEGITYPEGNAVSVVYDDFGNITTRTAQPKPGSGLASVTETANYPTASCFPSDFNVLCNRPTWYRDGLGRQTDFQYNALGQLTEQTDPADVNGVRRRTIVTYETSTGLSRRSVVRVCGNISTCGTPDEIRTEYEYWGNTFLPSVERRIDAARGETLETHYTYDDAGRLKVEDGPMPLTGDAKYFHYDILGRRTLEIGPAESTGIRLARRLNPRDSDDKLLSVEEGSVTSPTDTSLTVVFRRIDLDYDARRNPELETVSATGTTHTLVQRTFDLRGRLECEARRMNPAVFVSPPVSACTLGTEGSFGPDRVTRNVYDAAGQLLQVQRGYGTALQQNYATYTYSANGKRQTVKDANNNLSTFEYDGFDRLFKLRFPVATTGASQSSTTDYEQYGYDAVGNRTSLRKRDGRTIGYTHDALNRVRVKTVPTSASGAPGYSVYNRYDVRGLLTQARFSSDSGAGVTNTYDGFGWLRSSSSNMGGTARTVTSDYDLRGNRTEIAHPDGAFFKYAYDTADRLFHLSENGSSITLASIFPDEQGRRDRIDRDVTGAITDYDYDPISRLEVLTHDLDGAGSGNDAGFGFAYNPASQIVSRSLTNNAYEYPVTPATRIYAVNGRNQYTQVGGTTHTWDANGNLTSDGATTFGYDTENRLVSASGAKNASLAYDPLGRLYQVTSGSSMTRFVYDGDRLIAEYNGSGTLLRRYVHGAGIDEPLVWYEGAAVSSASRRYLHANHQGSIVATSNASGAKLQIHAYDPYGVTATSNTWRFQYTGQAAILELGQLYYKARFYNPPLGRFMQTDPIGYEDDVNLYAYVGNDPLNTTDPTGEWGLAGAFFGAIAGGTGGFIASGDSLGEKIVGTISGAVAGAVVGLVAPQTSSFVGMAAAGAVASATGQAIGSTANAAIDKGVENVSLSDVNVSATTTVAGGLGAGVGGVISRGVASMTAQPIVGNTVQAAGTPTATGLTAGAVAEGATIGAAEKVGPIVVDAARRGVEEIGSDEKYGK